MQATPIDPRTVERLDHDIRYRVYFWKQGPPAEGTPPARIGWASDEWALTDARDIYEVLAWADEHADGRTFELFCDVVAGDRLISATKLFGDDPTDNDDDDVASFWV